MIAAEMMDIRRKVLISKRKTNIIYYRKNIVCDGTNFFDTGFAPFSTANANVDFKITFKINSFEYAGTGTAQDTLFSCKYEGTLSGQQWPGFLLRKKSGANTQIFEMGGYSYWNINIADALEKEISLWRQNGAWKGQIEDGTIQTLNVRIATFNQNIIIGSGEQTNGTKFRNAKATFDYFKLEYI